MEKIAYNIRTLAKLRCCVAFLGEKPNQNWWDSRYLDSTGQKFMENIFPKAAFAAAVEGASKSACGFHDERIGKGNVFHLFRLPISIEQSIHQFLLSEEIREFSQSITDQESAMQIIREMVDSSVDAPEGPVQVGTRKDLGTDFSIAEMAKHYLCAFESSQHTLPYFVDE